MDLKINGKAGGVTIECHVTPRSAKSKIKGVRNGALAVALHAPPVEGRANEELIRLIAEILDIPKSYVSIIKGETGRDKLVFIRGVTKERIKDLIKE